jgi:hypothetical protein
VPLPSPLTPVSILSEHPSWPYNPRRSLALDQAENPNTIHPGLKEENEECATYPGVLSPSTYPTTEPSVSEGDGQGAQLVFLDMAQNIFAYDILSWCLSLEGSSFFICMCSFSAPHPPLMCTRACLFVLFHRLLWTVLSPRHISPNGMALPITSWGFHSQLPFLVSGSVREGQDWGHLCVYTSGLKSGDGAAYVYWTSLKPDCPLSVTVSEVRRG